MKNMNEIKFIGRLAKDPEVRYTKTGKAVASFPVAVSRAHAAPGQEAATDFIPVVAWGNLAEHCGNTFAKGYKVFVQGRLQIRSYETADSQKRRVTEVVAEFVALSIESDKGQNGGNTSSKPADFNQFGQEIDEEIPF